MVKVTYEKESGRIIKELGGNPKEYYHANHSDVVFGGIAAINFTVKPEGWVKRGESWQHLCMPSVKNKSAWEKINALPTLTYNELNEIYKFKKQSVKYTGPGIGFSTAQTIGYEFVKDFVLLNLVDDAKWDPQPGCTEILASEYKKLSKK